jgi:imidazoleglycerol-phosphate dehydratase
MSALVRETNETHVRLTLRRRTVDEASGEVRTTDAFLDHMLATFARYADLYLDVTASGDLRHHLIEDVAITLGLALRDEVPPACARFGNAVIPMDDALVEVAIDLGGRAYYRGPVPTRLYDHFFRSLADNAAMNLHIRVLRGRDRHHVVEAAIKALGLSVGQALATEERVFSTKGAVRLRREDRD